MYTHDANQFDESMRKKMRERVAASHLVGSKKLAESRMTYYSAVRSGELLRRAQAHF